MEIWINPECSKCRAVVDVLDAADLTYTVRRYLDEPPRAAEIQDVLERLGLEPWDIARLNEPIAHELKLDQLGRTDTTREAWIKVMAQNPVLIQRPIITTGDDTARVVRDSHALAAVLETSTQQR